MLTSQCRSFNCEGRAYPSRKTDNGISPLVSRTVSYASFGADRIDMTKLTSKDHYIFFMQKDREISIHGEEEKEGFSGVTTHI